MKTQKILTIIISIFVIMMCGNTCNAYSISVNDISVKEGEEFTVNVNVDEDTWIGKGTIKYDSSKIEFIGSNQKYMEATADDGEVRWMYINYTDNGTRNFEFTFKLKEKGSYEMVLDDLDFISTQKNEYYTADITGNTSFKVKSKNNIVFIGIIVIIALIIILLIAKKGKNKRKDQSKKRKK